MTGGPRVALGMLARSDRASEPLLDRILEIMEPSFDGIEIRYDEGRRIADFSAARNELVRRAEEAGYDWMVMLDSDECMFPADIGAVRRLMTPERRLIVLPRYEFVQDFEHFDPTEYPDYQRRVFRLHAGYHFRRRVHEGLYRHLSPLSETRLGAGLVSDATPIYHYGRLKAASEVTLKLVNYDRLANGEPPLDTLPHGIPVREDGFYRAIERFPGPHPLTGFAPEA